MIITTAIRKINNLKRRIKIIQGGTSAGKTYGILPILITKAAAYPRTEISVVAESIPHLRRGALKDFLRIMKETGRYFDDRFNKSLLRYEFANGSVIEFFSADDSSKLRGARRDVLYINECNNVTFESYNEGCGKLMYDAWGGKAGLGWSRNKLRELGLLTETESNPSIPNSSYPGEKAKDIVSPALLD